MASQNRTKLNSLLKNWPPGTVGVHKWLSSRSVTRQLAEAYRKSSWLQRLQRGAYIRHGDDVEWPGAVYALQQQLRLTIHPAAKTALDMQGRGHFLSLGPKAHISLFGAPGERLPAWFRQHDWGVSVRFSATNLFAESVHLGLMRKEVGAFSIQISAPERAAMELVHLVPHQQSYEEARLLFEGLTTLRPRVVQALLEQCRSVKVKRLFLFLADSYGFAWLRKVDLGRVDLGKGKRVIVRGGRFDPKYQISILDHREAEAKLDAAR